MGGFASFVHVSELFMVSMAISTINLYYFTDKFETDNVMHLFRIIMKNKNSIFVSNHYFRRSDYFCDLLKSTEFYRYFRGVATFGGSLL